MQSFFFSRFVSFRAENGLAFRYPELKKKTGIDVQIFMPRLGKNRVLKLESDVLLFFSAKTRSREPIQFQQTKTSGTHQQRHSPARKAHHHCSFAVASRFLLSLNANVVRESQSGNVVWKTRKDATKENVTLRLNTQKNALKKSDCSKKKNETLDIKYRTRHSPSIAEPSPLTQLSEARLPTEIVTINIIREREGEKK